MSITGTITNTTKALPEWSLSTLKSGNDAILKATKKMVGAIEPATHLIPKAPLADRLQDLPQPSEFISQWFNYMDKVVAEQKRFGLDLADTVSASAPTKPTAVRRKPAAAKAA
jgi:hypothetical protein